MPEVSLLEVRLDRDTSPVIGRSRGEPVLSPSYMLVPVYLVIYLVILWWAKWTHWIGCTVSDELGMGRLVDACLFEMSPPFKIPSDGEMNGRDFDLGHLDRIRHPQNFYPDLISRCSGTFQQGIGFRGEVIY